MMYNFMFSVIEQRLTQPSGSGYNIITKFHEVKRQIDSHYSVNRPTGITALFYNMDQDHDIKDRIAGKKSAVKTVI
jgi:hypothetical protein